MSESLKDQVIKGASWNGLERFGTAFFLFVSNLVLARLLSPDDFGCIGMLMVFISISDAIVDGGFGAALVQKKNASQIDFSTIFIWDVVLSLLLYLILFLLSPLIADFYEMDSLSTILRVQGVVLLFNGLSNIQRTMLTRQMNFKKQARINLSAMIIGSCLGILCAFCGMGIWSLVVKLLSTSILACICFWLTTTWFPNRCFSIKSLKSLFSFGGFVFLTSITNSIYSNIISLVIGKSFSSTTLGYFTQARKLEDIPRQTISSVVNNVTFPAFSSIQDDKIRLKKAISESLKFLSFINFSLTILMMVIARPIILLLFSEKWLPSVPYFQVICLYGLIMSIIELNLGVYKAVGKSNLLFITGIIRRVIGITLIISGTLWGIKGVLIGYVVGQYISFVIVSYPLNTIIGYSLLDQIKHMLPNLIVSIIAGIFSYFIVFGVELNPFMLCCIQVIVFCVTIVLLSILFKIEGYQLAKKIVQNRIFI